jgi:HPt (histidine-containing phosphotransfer) domain-containing protein
MAPQTRSDRIVSELVQSDPSYAALVEDFIAELGGRIQELNSALNAGQFDTLKMLAHQLKGAGGGHGYPALTQVAAGLEQHAVAQQLDACKQSIGEITSLVARLAVSD